MSNINLILNSNIQVVDITGGNSFAVVNRALNLLLAGTATSEGFFLQVPNGTLTITLPNATVWFVIVINRHATQNLTVNYTPQGGSTTSLVLVPGGVFIYAQPSEGAGGISALSLTATAITPAEVYVGY